MNIDDRPTTDDGTTDRPQAHSYMLYNDHATS